MKKLYGYFLFGNLVYCQRIWPGIKN